MKKLKTVTLSRSSAAAYLTLTGPEVVLLRHVPAWMRWLYAELRGLSDFKTGWGKASWPQLVALMDWDKPERGRKAAEDLGTDKLRRALEQLESLGLVWRDEAENRRSKVLIFRVPAVAGAVTPARKTASNSANAPTEVKEPQKRQLKRQGAQEEFLIPQAHETSTPTGTAPPPEFAAAVAAIRRRRGEEKLSPPKGLERSPCGPAPRARRAGPNSHQVKDEGPLVGGPPPARPGAPVALCDVLPPEMKTALERGALQSAEQDPTDKAPPSPPKARRGAFEGVGKG